MKYVHAFLIALVLMDAPSAGAQGVSLSGGIDLRAHAGNSAEDALVLQGLFLNARKVFSDDLGDRWIAVAQADADDNLAKIRPYQLYLQYKGPLGRWNLRAGHYLLPFGLLSEYDTERLVLGGVEEENLGLKLDTGFQVFGYADSWDWSLSLSRGIGRRWLSEADAGNYALAARLARGGDDWKVGLSALAGEILTDEPFPAAGASVSQRKGALDFTAQRERLALRSELSAGTEDSKAMAAAVLLPSYSLTGSIDLDGRYALIARDAASHELGLGLTAHLGKGWVARPAATVTFHEGKVTDALVAQLYWDFSTTR